MPQNTVHTPVLSLDKLRAWLLALAFVAGNIILPQLCHLIPQGGLIFLPIYAFTLIGALTCGWQVGLLVAMVSPVANSMLFGMPPVAMLPIILTKGALLVGAVEASRRIGFKSIFIAAVFIVMSYQVVGCAIESIFAGSITAGFADMNIGLPGILLQIVVASLTIFLKGTR